MAEFNDVTYAAAVDDAVKQANDYTDSMLNAGQHVGDVTNGSSFPTTRKDGSPLHNDDYVKALASSTFPFTIGTVTFDNRFSTGIYLNGNWFGKPGVLQETPETPVGNPSEESVAGTAVVQSDINKEFVKATKQYEYQFATASADWLIEHNLGRYPRVTAFDASGKTIVGNINYTNNNTLTVHFANAQAGKAILN